MNQYPPQNSYYDPYNVPPPPQPPKPSGVSTASVVCGIVAFFLNPLYLVSLAAVITGIVGLVSAKNGVQGTALAGLILGATSFFCQLIIDICLIPLTFGLCFCI